MRYLVLVLIWIAAGSPAFAQTLGERVRTYFEPVAASRDFSGIIAARQGDALMAYEAFGLADFEAGTELSPRTRFETGSLTRALVIATLLELEADNRLDRAAAVRDLIPELTTDFTANVGAVISGTAPLPGVILPGDLRDARGDTFIAWFNHALGDEGLLPAEQSDAWLPLLTLMAERAGGGRMELLATMEVFAPLGMTGSAFYRGSGQAPTRLAERYRPAALPLELTRAPALDAGLIHRGWLASVDDLLAFGTALSSRRIDFFDDTGPVLGGLVQTVVEGEAVYVLEGEVSGGRAGLLILPSRELVVAWALNLDSYPADAMAQILTRLVRNDPIESLPVRRAAYPFEDGHFDAVGRYLMPGYGALELRSENSELVLYPSAEILTPVGPDRLVWRSQNTELVYRRRADGAVEHLAATRHLPLTLPESFDIVRTDLPEPISEGPN